RRFQKRPQTAVRQAIHRQFLTSHRQARKIRTITYALHSLEFDSVQAKARLKPELRAQTEQTKATTKTQRRKEFRARNTAQPGHPRYRKPTDNPSHGASNWALASLRISCVCAVNRVTGTLARRRNLLLAVELDYFSLVHVVSEPADISAVHGHAVTHVAMTHANLFPSVTQGFDLTDQIVDLLGRHGFMQTVSQQTFQVFFWN